MYNNNNKLVYIKNYNSYQLGFPLYQHATFHASYLLTRRAQIFFPVAISNAMILSNLQYNASVSDLCYDLVTSSQGLTLDYT